MRKLRRVGAQAPLPLLESQMHGKLVIRSIELPSWGIEAQQGTQCKEELSS